MGTRWLSGSGLQPLGQPHKAVAEASPEPGWGAVLYSQLEEAVGGEPILLSPTGPLTLPTSCSGFPATAFLLGLPASQSTMVSCKASNYFLMLFFILHNFFHQLFIECLLCFKRLLDFLVSGYLFLRIIEKNTAEIFFSNLYWYCFPFLKFVSEPLYRAIVYIVQITEGSQILDLIDSSQNKSLIILLPHMKDLKYFLSKQKNSSVINCPNKGSKVFYNSKSFRDFSGQIEILYICFKLIIMKLKLPEATLSSCFVQK